MTNRATGKVALITGAARGQGRSHAVRLAREGADVIAVDLCSQISTVPYPMATVADFDETVRQVEEANGRIFAVKADVRDFDGLRGALDAGVAEFGRLDIVVANAGIVSYATAAVLAESAWADVIDTNLTGAWHTVKAAIPHMTAGGRGGSIVLTSSVAGLRGYQNMAHYTAAKHGLVGLMRALALELAPQMIRVNTIHPGTVDTEMVQNGATYRLFGPDLTNPTRDDVAKRFESLNALPVPWIDVADTSDAMAFLVSDEARYITGTTLPVDAGTLLK